MSLSIQKRLAAELLKCGESRVRFDPERIEDIEDAITRGDIRRLIDEGAIYEAPKRGNTRRAEKGRRGPGKRKGGKYSTLSRKERWLLRVRAQRRYLRRLKEARLLKEGAYRSAYLQIKAGRFKSVAELKEYLKSSGLLLAGA
ncbi:MAG: 50S ribosomal protein L19e [Nitrososphaerota archaeon]|nr:50S ribosomal protein L19e [Candidatus Calditenuaceae archaeon]MDW8072658.1 50S ribosomal protein L19e [Nitrososphaerota archaeon]